jgi:uncharacterized surface protein with fasciclin (FAS1) repeats
MNIKRIMAAFNKLKAGLRFNRSTLHLMRVILPADKSIKMSTIVDVVVADKNLATMLKSVKAAGMETQLTEKGPYTVFAPTDLAFGKLAQGEIIELLKPENKLKLTTLLKHHIVEGRQNLKDLTDGQKLKTLDGKELEVKVNNNFVTINGARLQSRDGNASNGVVHSLDAVINHN